MQIWILNSSMFWKSDFHCFLSRFLLISFNIVLSWNQLEASWGLKTMTVYTIVGIGYPKFGYPRVIPEPESNFGYGLGWVCVWNPWVFSGWVPIKFKILGFFGYYPRVPVRIGYPKFGHPRVIPKQYYYKKCSYIQRYKYY